LYDFGQSPNTALAPIGHVGHKCWVSMSPMSPAVRAIFLGAYVLPAATVNVLVLVIHFVACGAQQHLVGFLYALFGSQTSFTIPYWTARVVWSRASS